MRLHSGAFFCHFFCVCVCQLDTPHRVQPEMFRLSGGKCFRTGEQQKARTGRRTDNSMAITIAVKNGEEIPEVMKEFVTEADGVYTYDEERAFKALKAERENAKSARNELSAFKALNLTPEQITAKLSEFDKLGKSPAEIAEIIAEAGKQKPDFKKSTEYLEQQKQIKELLKLKDDYYAELAKNQVNTRNDFVRKAVRSLPDKFDKEKLLNTIEEFQLFERFKLNDSKDGLAPVDDRLPSDFLENFAEKNGYVKTSVPGKAAPGNADLSRGGNGSFEAAKKEGNIRGMLDNCPEID